MQANELHEHADMLLSAVPLVPPSHRGSLTAAADYLSACADAMDAGPVAWMDPLWPTGDLWPHDAFMSLPVDGWIPLYPVAMPAQAQPLRLPEPLTDEEIDALTDVTGYETNDRAVRYLVEAGERRMKEVNK